MTGPAGDFVGVGAVAATGDTGNNANANTVGPNTLTEPAMFISSRIDFFSRGYTFLLKATSLFRVGLFLPAPASTQHRNLTGHGLDLSHIFERPVLDKIQPQYLNGDSMKNVLHILLLVLFALPLIAQGAPPQNAPDQPYVMEYYYKVQWGHQQEFLQLFLKNHYPLLRKEVESGRMLSVKIETPSNHMTEDARWDYRVTIRFKNSTVATTANPDEDAMTRQLWPDQETYKREEQRRFEILLAHWDLPVSDVTPPARK
jgi:hypothetical protein